jgi:hypothetical protein
MADEYLQMSTDFAKLGSNYCANFKKIVPNTEERRLVSIYEAGINGATSGYVEIANNHYQSLSDDEKQFINNQVRLSGVLPMLAAANERIGPDSIFDSFVLFKLAKLFPKIKAIIRDITHGSMSPLSLVFRSIDMLIENLVGSQSPFQAHSLRQEEQQMNPVGGSTIEKDPSGIAPVTGESLTQPPK